MNAQKLTQKSLEALQEAQSIASRNSNQAVDQQHLMLALLSQENGLVPQLFVKMDIAPENIEAALTRAVDDIPKVLAICVKIAYKHIAVIMLMLTITHIRFVYGFDVQHRIGIIIVISHTALAKDRLTEVITHRPVNAVITAVSHRAVTGEHIPLSFHKVAR